MSRHRSSPADETPARMVGIRRLNLGVAGHGIGIAFVSQTFAETVDWSVCEPKHEVRVWRRGKASLKEVVFDRGPSGYITPGVSNVWVIPAGSQSAASARNVVCEFAQLTLPPSLTVSAPLRPVVGRRDPLLHHMVERIADTLGRTDLVGKLLRDSLADSLRLHILDSYGERSSTPRRAGRVLDQAAQGRLVDFLRDGLDDEIDLPTMAELTEMKVDAFRRAFIRTFGTTPYQYVLDLRIEKSKTLLTTTDQSMTEISIAAGFSSPSHFATTFKQRVGVTPTVYRNGL
ncbi:helix-turn-helix transcriptional regulator [Mycolicibacterium phlei]|jgi:AraC family transcriptional regulator|nr:AraC family transcriptional regulator [Mycolicibacterium phlei]KXW78735.1 AraC family transcriptional regulator [Mycolicibacterium phlei DSM 43071]